MDDPFVGIWSYQSPGDDAWPDEMLAQVQKAQIKEAS